ncbi:MAG: DMT family transporter [Coprobacillus sp.]
MDKKSLLSVHLAVFLFGASGLFVKFIDMPAFLILLGRAMFSAIALYIYIHIKKYPIRLKYPRHYFWNLMAGVLLTVHWFFFILSVQVSTVAIGTITFATYPFIVSFIEPYVFKEKFQYKNLITLFLVIIGVMFLIPAFQLTNENTLGIIYGMIGSVSYALLSLINRRLAANYDSAVINLYEQGVSVCLVTLLISIIDPPISIGTQVDFIALIIYGIIFTALAHSLYIHGLKGVKAQTASIISVLEPVYSIFLAMLLLKEGLIIQEIIGIALILISVILASYFDKNELQKQKNQTETHIDLS